MNWVCWSVSTDLVISLSEYHVVYWSSERKNMSRNEMQLALLLKNSKHKRRSQEPCEKLHFKIPIYLEMWKLMKIMRMKYYSYEKIKNKLHFQMHIQTLFIAIAKKLSNYFQWFIQMTAVVSCFPFNWPKVTTTECCQNCFSLQFC